MQVKSCANTITLDVFCESKLFVPMSGHQTPLMKFDRIFSCDLFVSSPIVF